MALRVIAEHTEGYGTAIAHSPREGVWATVAYSQFYLWRQENLLYSVPLAGHFGGSPQFSVDGETLYVGTRA
ncbi:MAG TPA: hypothetical protein VK864_08125, partial [Longimicrobiales bacterium]|nr:hypothetical protein [Longimicrobiales bacterium]